MEEKVRIARCKAQRLQVPAPLLGHIAYVQALENFIGCLVALSPTSTVVAGNPGGQLGVSVKRMRNMLMAMAYHAANNCQACETERRFNIMIHEQRLVESVAIYEGSVHAKSPSSLSKISVSFKTADGSSGEEGGEFPLLPGYLLILRGHYEKEEPPAATVETPAAATG